MYNKGRKEQVLELWNKGLGVTQISKEIGISTSAVSENLNKIFGNGRRDRCIYKRRIFSLNENFFEEINTEGKAYFLGLLYADGCLTNNQNLIVIALHEKDKEILDRFNKELEYTRPLHFVRSNQYRLEVSCRKLRRDIEKYGITPNKSKTLKFPNNIPNDFINHFIRGYFDGDGCIYTTKDYKRAELSIACSEDFGRELCKIMNNLGISLNNKINWKRNCYYCRSSKKSDVINFYSLLYKDATIFLKRKKEKFDIWLKQRNLETI